MDKRCLSASVPLLPGQGPGSGCPDTTPMLTLQALMLNYVPLLAMGHCSNPVAVVATAVTVVSDGIVKKIAALDITNMAMTNSQCIMCYVL